MLIDFFKLIELLSAVPTTEVPTTAAICEDISTKCEIYKAFCGNHAFVTGGSLVRKDVPPYVKAAREPLSYVGINSVGLRRRGYGSEKIKEIQNIYRLLYQRNYNNSQACEIIEAEMEVSDERDEILMFIRNSQRGIMKGYTKSN